MNSTQHLHTQGCLGDVSVENDVVRLKGWITSIYGGRIDGFKIMIGEQIIENFKIDAELPSPDVKKLFPNLNGAENARFFIYIPLSEIKDRQLFNSLVRLTPLINGQSGDVLFGLLESTLPVPEKEDRVGVGGSFKFVACDFLGHFFNKAKLQPNEVILDAGCGVGRMAYSLAYYLDSTARYEGFDIVEKWINWCQDVIHQHHPNFNFKWADIYNKLYNPKGKYKVEEFIFPYVDEQFDFVFLTSVFTHLYAPAVYNYLQQTSRVLKSGGRCLCTCFLMNEESQQLIQGGKSSQNLIYQEGDSFFSDLEIPENAMGHPESLMMNWIEECGFTLQQKYNGLWCGRSESTNYQDMLILQKK